jgi:hypothetical protein
VELTAKLEELDILLRKLEKKYSTCRGKKKMYKMKCLMLEEEIKRLRELLKR